MEKVFKIYAPTGNGLFSTTLIDEDAVFHIYFKKIKYEIVVHA